MIPALETAATLADQAGGALHSAAVQPTPATVLRRVLTDLQAAVEIVAGALPVEVAAHVEISPEIVDAPAPKPRRARK